VRLPVFHFALDLNDRERKLTFDTHL
jgi:hypothetical protein